MIEKLYQLKFPSIDIDGKFFLREQSVEDVRTFFDYYKNSDVNRYILASVPASLADARAEIEYCKNMFYRKLGLYWTIARWDNNEMVGAAGLYLNNSHHRGELCYELSKEYWGQGIMTRAINKIIEHSFRDFELKRMEAITLKENIASIATLNKVGFKYEASMANYRYFQGRPYTVEMFGLTPESHADHLSAMAREKETCC